MPEYKQAPADGSYTVPGRRGRYLVRAGGRMPTSATFIPKGAKAPEKGEDAPQVATDSDELKWYRDYREKAEAEGKEPYPRLEGESQAKFMERIATLDQGGDSTDTQGDGAGETT
jgi:hypothetical protein